MSLALVPATRETPAALEAEQAVIGAVLLEQHAWDAASELQSRDFLFPAHVAIWDAIRALAAQGAPADPLLVWDRIRAAGDAGRLEGGLSYLAGLPGFSGNVAHYVARVRDTSARRRLIAALAEATAKAYDPEVDVQDSIAGVHASLDKLVTGNDSARYGELSEGVLASIQERSKSPVGARGARTGIDRLDETTGGLQPGWLVIIAAETGGGKTALAMQTAINVVLGGGTALACNLEMTKEELVERAMVHVGGVNSQLVRLGTTRNDLLRRLVDADVKLGPTNFYLDDTANTSALVAARARRWRTRHRDSAGILVVDFVQLMQGVKQKQQTRAQEVGVIAQELKALAKELRVPVILVSQLNRAGVKADRPSKSDLKESGDLENAADLILLPHNTTGTGDGPVEIIVDKFRHGERLVVDAEWIGRHFRFANPNER